MALERLQIDHALGAYLDGLAAPEDHIAELYAEMADDPWAMMMTHPDLGRLLRVLVRAAGGRAVLEVGTFVGTSAAWMAAGLEPDGRIDTLEADPSAPIAPRRGSPGSGWPTASPSTAGPPRTPCPAWRRAPTTSPTSTPTRPAIRCTWTTRCGWCGAAA